MTYNSEFLTLKFVLINEEGKTPCVKKLDACAVAKHKIILRWPKPISFNLKNEKCHLKND